MLTLDSIFYQMPVQANGIAHERHIRAMHTTLQAKADNTSPDFSNGCHKTNRVVRLNCFCQFSAM